MAQVKTSLRNLFYYIRDLYDIAGDYYDFAKEKGIDKTFGIGSWPLEVFFDTKAALPARFQGDFVFNINPNGLFDEDMILKISRPQLPSEPEIPPILKGYIAFMEDGTGFKKVTFTQETPKGSYSEEKTSAEGNTSIFGESAVNILRTPDLEYQQRKQAFRAYEKLLEQHYQKHFAIFELARLYDRLHDLYYNLKGRENRQLVLSFGLVSINRTKESYCNYLFEIPVQINLMKKAIELSIDRLSSRITCEAFFLGLLPELFPQRTEESIIQMRKDVMEAVDAFNISPGIMDLSYENLKASFMEPIREILIPFKAFDQKLFVDENPDFKFYGNYKEQGIQVSLSPIIQVRNVESHTAVSKDAARIAKFIESVEREEIKADIPTLFLKMFEVKGVREPEVLVAEPPVSPGELLFPLPYNKEQLEIVHRLEIQDTVIVKGPPGTGKSHTIANIISNQIAQGKRILVCSQNAKALSVIKDKIPKPIQDLTISMLSGTMSNIQLQNSVQTIISNLGQTYRHSELIKLQSRQNELYQEHQNVLQSIKSRIIGNTKQKSITMENGEEFTKSALEWALQYGEMDLKENPILDDIPYKMDVTGLPERLMGLYGAASVISAEDFKLHDYTFLDEDRIITPDAFRNMCKRIEELLDSFDPERYKGMVEELLDDGFYARLYELKESFSSHDDAVAYGILQSPNFDVSLLNSFIRDNHGDLEQISAYHRESLNHIFSLQPIEKLNAETILQHIDQLSDRITKDGRIGAMGKLLLNGTQKKIMACLIDDSLVDTVEELQLLRSYVSMHKLINLWMKKVNNLLDTFKDQGKFSDWKHTSVLKKLVEHCSKVDAINQIICQMGQNRLEYWDAKRNQFFKYWGASRLYLEYIRIQNRLQSYILELSGTQSRHPLLKDMSVSVQSLNADSYQQQNDAYLAVLTRYRRIARYESLYQIMFLELPQTVKKLNSFILEGGLPKISLEQVRDGILGQKIISLMNSMDATFSGMESDLQALQHIRANLFVATTECIAYSTWMKLSGSTTDRQSAALHAWLNSLISIGRSHGRNKAKNLAAAIQHMQTARHVVPVWIMTISTAITFFNKPDSSQFDLLILDEASQCDISSFNLAFRARKSVIVGDENQTAVTIDSSKFGIDRVNSLVESYFADSEYKTQFNVTNNINSIYSIASVIYSRIIYLREHFRCMPEIIGFSNQHFYNGSIIPLRSSGDMDLGFPIEIIRVEDDNKDDKKKELIVNRVVEEVNQVISQYRSGKLSRLPSIGVICLDSSNQTHINALIRGLAGNPEIKGFEEELSLIIGTSREFQGDERDLVFLTITATHSKKIKDGETLIAPPIAQTSEEIKRIYNVAASRGIYKSVLIHSIVPEAIDMMSVNCYRKKLLDYYQGLQQTRTQKLIDEDSLINSVDSELGAFGREVCEELIRMGYIQYLRPSFKIGHFTLDFALFESDVKLGIICDGYRTGDVEQHIGNSIEQQQILERVGWKFYRIQSTWWAYQKPLVVSSLKKWIGKYLKPELVSGV